MTHQELLTAAVNDLKALHDKVGVMQKGGKKYTMVQDRVLVWRKHFALAHGLETEVLRDDGKCVQVRCRIRNDANQVIGSGICEEIRGSSSVNTTSAIENCETSAIGRALASLGLHGGEFASANELEKAEGIEHKLNKATAAAPAGPKIIADEIPFDANDARFDWTAWVDDQISNFTKHRNIAEHKNWSTQTKSARNSLLKEDPTECARLETAYVKLKNELNKGAS